MPGSFFSRLFPSSKRNVHLRHVIYLGSIIERRAEIFYRDMAEKCDDGEVKDLYLLLASEEKRHFQLLDGILSRWKNLALTPKDLKSLEAKEQLEKVFESSPGSGIRNVIEYALNEEKKMVSFYESYEKDFVSLWKLTTLQEMIGEEKGHVRMLSEMMSKF